MIHAIQMKRPDGQLYSIPIQSSYVATKNVKKPSTDKKDYDPCCACIV